MLVSLRLCDEFVKEVLDETCNVFYLVADEEFEVHEHLVVAASS